MKNELYAEILERCISRLQSGEELDQILADFPQAREEILPYLAVTQDLRAAASGIHDVPRSAQVRSKARFLQAAAQPRRSRSWLGGLFSRFNYATALGMVVLVLLVGSVGVNIAAASALPGDLLYPVKLANEQTRLALAGDDASRLRLQDEFEQERLEEIKVLLDNSREEEVKFEGVLEPRNGDWWVNGIRLQLPEEWLGSPLLKAGINVEIRGVTRPGGAVLVVELRMRDGEEDEGDQSSTEGATDDSSGKSETETPEIKDTPEDDTDDVTGDDKTSEPTRTEEATRTEEPTRTERPTRTEEPTRTREPTRTPKP